MILFLLLFLTLYSNCFAKELLYDNFNSGSLDNWVLEYGGYSLSSNGTPIDGVYGWNLRNDSLYGEAGYYERSYIRANISEIKDFSIELDSVNYNGVDQSFLLRSSIDRSSYYEVNFRFLETDWNQDNNNITIRAFKNGRYYDLYNSRGNIVVNLTQNVSHKLGMRLDGNLFEVFFDGNKLFEFVDLNNYIDLGGYIFIKNWAGSFNYGRVLNSFDNISISDLTDEVRPKVIVLPGLGGSWNTKAIVSGDVSGQYEWKMTPFVQNYDKLISALEYGGYEKNKDLFVWNYDWRRSVSDISSNLDTFINQKILPGDKFYLLGHSLGGLVSRIWAEDHASDQRLVRVISMGSPHLGSVDAYPVWSGGSVGGEKSVFSIAMNLLIEINKSKYGSKVDTVRGMSPVVNDLIPVFNFAKKNSQIVPYSDMQIKNNFLIGRNGISIVGEKLLPIYSTGFDTEEYVILGDKITDFDVRGIWKDGKVIGIEKINTGDGTVLKNSAFFDGFEDLGSMSSNHGDIVDGSVQKVADEIGVSLAGFNYGMTARDINKMVIFLIMSPASLEMNCGQQSWVSDDQGFLVAYPDDVNANCSLNILPIGEGGDYQLLGLGKDGKMMFMYKSNIGIGETQLLGFLNGSNEFKVNKESGYQMINELCKKYLEDYEGNVWLDICIEGCGQKDEKKVRESIVGFVREKHNWQLFEDVEKLTGEMFGEYSQCPSDPLEKINSLKKLVGEINRNKNLKNYYLGDFGVNMLRVSDDLYEKLASESDCVTKTQRSVFGEMMYKSLWF